MSHSIPQGIPIRRVQLSHLSELPTDYGTTPGGTLFSTTPGGTRIIYDRNFLLKCRSSPMANTPPSNLPDIPGVTSPEKSPVKASRKIGEASITGKENGVDDACPSCLCNHQPTYRIPRAMQAEMKYDPCSLFQSPLLRFRQRSNARQNVAMFEKAYQELNQSPMTSFRDAKYGFSSPSFCSPVFALDGSYDDRRAGFDYSRSDESFQTLCSQPLGLTRRPSVTSPLYMWRENKLKQNPSHNTVHSNHHPVFVKCLNPSIPPQLSIYRGRARLNSHGSLPVNLCDSLEKLFRSQSESNCKRIPPLLPSVYLRR